MRVLLPAVAVLALSSGAQGGGDTTARVTTDTLEYCGTLATRLATLPGSHREPALTLANDGMRLCGNGHIRTGVAKLRRALRAAQVQAQ